jgi:hypothetical protein
LRKTVYLGLPVLLVASAVAVVSDISGSDSTEQVRRSAVPQEQRASSAPGSAVSFSHLAAQRSNSCGLQAAQLPSYPDEARLQGSCCFPLDAESYREQVHGLRGYRRIPQIPRDPYDIPASLAKRLVRYQKSIVLTPAQRVTYRKAMRMTRQKAPCCCPCWRLDAFQGMSNYLIARRRFRVRELADVIDLVEGCGGPKAHHSPS